MISAVMAVLEVIGQVLKSGDPLPERLRTPLVNRCYGFCVSMVRNENYRRYCVAATSYLKFLSVIDELVLVLKAALGESHVVTRPDQAVV